VTTWLTLRCDTRACPWPPFRFFGRVVGYLSDGFLRIQTFFFPNAPLPLFCFHHPHPLTTGNVCGPLLTFPPRTRASAPYEYTLSSPCPSWSVGTRCSGQQDDPLSWIFCCSPFPTARSFSFAIAILHDSTPSFELEKRRLALPATLPFCLFRARPKRSCPMVVWLVVIDLRFPCI